MAIQIKNVSPFLYRKRNKLLIKKMLVQKNEPALILSESREITSDLR